MARITVEDCLKKVNNRFTLVHLASKRVRQLRKGTEPTITSKNRDIVISLRELAAGNILKSETIGNNLASPIDITPEEIKEEPTEEVEKVETTEEVEKEEDKEDKEVEGSE